MNYLPFYKLHDWILEEFGASGDAVIIAIIYSFEENGIECKLSYSQFADILKITRPRAIERIRRLIESGYISVITNRTHTNTYSVNRNAFSTSSENGTSDENLLVPKTALALVPKTELGSAANGTSTSSKNGTQKEKEREKKRKREREQPQAAAPARSFIEIPNFPNVRLTADEYAMLRFGIDMIDVKKDLSAYLAIIDDGIRNGKKYNDHFSSLRKWILHDGGKLIDADRMQERRARVEAIEEYNLGLKKNGSNERFQ